MILRMREARLGLPPSHPGVGSARSSVAGRCQRSSGAGSIEAARTTGAQRLVAVRDSARHRCGTRARHRAGPGPGRSGLVGRRGLQAGGWSSDRAHPGGADLPAAGERIGGPRLLELGRRPRASQPISASAGASSASQALRRRARRRQRGQPGQGRRGPTTATRGARLVDVGGCRRRGGGRRGGGGLGGCRCHGGGRRLGHRGCRRHRLGGHDDLVGRGVGVACSVSEGSSVGSSVGFSVGSSEGVAVSGASRSGTGGDRHRDRRQGAGGGRQVDPPHPHSRSAAARRARTPRRIHARDRVAPGVRVSMSEAFLPHVGGDCPEVCAGNTGAGITRTG